MRDKKAFFKRAKEKEEDLKRENENSEKIGGKDFFAMFLSAFLMFVPICIAILAALSLFVLWLFRAI